MSSSWHRSVHAVAEVFIDHTDSYVEIRKRAIEKAREFFTKALAADSAESVDS
jgi:hypothetical protein